MAADDPTPDAAVLERAGATVVRRIEWESRDVWVVDIGGAQAVLHRHPAHRALDELEWELGLLEQLARHFPVARPVRAFGGEAAVEHAGTCWTLQTLLPGSTPGWDPDLDLRSLGSFLARFHQVSRAVDVAPRPAAPPPLASLPDRQWWSGLAEQVGRGEAGRFLERVDAVIEELEGHGVLEPDGILHGDVTTFNVLVDGSPAEPVGLVDFATATHDATIADLGFTAWMSGRLRFVPDELDLDRVHDLVAGYHAVLPLPPDAVRWFPPLVLVRPFQLLARWLPRGDRDLTTPLQRLDHLWARRTELATAVAVALGG